MNKIKKILIRILTYIGTVLFLPFLFLERLIPREKNIFVFGSWNGNLYSDNSKALFEYILNNEQTIKPYWVTKNREIYLKLLKENKPVLMAYSIKGWLVSLRASVVFIVSSNSDVNKYAIYGAKQIWLYHGMPLKKIEYDKYASEKNISSKLMLMKLRLRSKYISATIASGDFFAPFLASAFQIKEEYVWLTGSPRTDFFHSGKTEKIINDLRKTFTGSRIILYMPTFRTTSYSQVIPYNPFVDKEFNSEKFADFLGKENIVFIYKPHLLDKEVCFSLSARFVLLNNNDYDELYVLISNIDILITDYSSVYFDYLSLHKPVILTPFDYEDYIKKSRGHYINYNLLPGIKTYNWDELMDIITEERYYSVSKEETDIFSKYNDGHASERCMKRVLELLD